MKFVFASDSFKGTISSEEAAQMLTIAAKEVFGKVECVSLPIADGGEGTIDAILSCAGGDRIYKEVSGPLYDTIVTYYGKIDDNKAIIEMAKASGLPLVKQEKRNPLNTTTYGTGELIKDALDKGFSEIYIAIGGSATNDGGIGCMRALGVRFLDKYKNELEGCGKDLELIKEIDISQIDSRISKTKFIVMCDVDNPLCGEHGATYTFSAQKGATKEIQCQLELGMRNYRDLLKKQFGIDADEIKGAGAAGGLGAALIVFLKSKLQSGIETVLSLSNFDNLIQDVDLVITGEGRTDWQSSHGKVLYGIGTHCKANRVPAVALVGSVGEGADEIYNHGIHSLFTTVSAPMTLEQALENANDYYLTAAKRMFRIIKVGFSLAK